jgi:hypothetical protein
VNPPAVDWTVPWLAPYRALGEPALRAVTAGDGGPTGGPGQVLATSVAEALDARVPPGAPFPVRFVAQSRLPPGEPYERFIAETGGVPTRDNLHDFFNGLVWLHRPMAKRRLNALQAAEIARCGIGATRGPLRDALTLFDENGAVLDAPPALWRALVARDWRSLFVTHRALWREARLQLFGHALLEKLATPRKPITAHVLLPGTSGARRLTDDDATLAAALDPAHLRAKPFVALPVLGVPLWWAGNEAPGFYDDADVFRPPRRPTPTTTRAAPTADRRPPPAA